MTRRRAAGEREPSRPLDDQEYEALARLLSERTGLLFSPQKRGEVESKVQAHLRENPGLAREDLVGTLHSSDDELQRLVNRLTIGESYFFRNRPHFAALTADIIPGLVASNAGSRRIRIWSAGCATGEEPYSLAILLEESFPDLRDWDVRITATDINTSFLERARQGLYTRWSFRGVEERLVGKYFREEGGGYQRIDPRIARRVEFGRFNLSRPPFVGRVSVEPFDLVVCRNVLIYFSFELANHVVGALAETLRPDGYLIVGHAESFPKLRELESVYSHATYYYRRGDPRRARGARAERLHTVSIPGIPVHDVARRPSAAPPRRRSRAPGAPSPRRRSKPPAVVSVERDRLLPDIEAAQEHADLGRLAEAEAILDRLLGGAGRLDHRVHFLRALVADQHDRTGDAIASLRQSIFLNKEFAIGHYYMGVICEREDDAKTAKRCFRNAVDIASRLEPGRVLEEGGGITAGVLGEIAAERIRELELA